ncbi:MAG TPA: SMR family transporter [Alcanivoracaceae bacterium]|nr:SMR family transporter [Alcanivoracaceae bacterium]
MLIPISLLAGSAALDVYANYCVKRSVGFSRWGWGFLALASIIVAFVVLSFAVRYLPLGVAYAVWGSLGMVGTALLDIFIFRSPLGKKGWVGIFFIVAGMLLLNMA